MRDDFDLTPALEVERELQRLSVELTHPYPRECLLCYVYRMLEFDCTGLRWALHYRDTVAPRATAVGGSAAVLRGRMRLRDIHERLPTPRPVPSRR